MPSAKHAEMEAQARADKEVAPFLKQLRKMLNQEMPEILRWTPNGRAFEIVDMELMMREVLPKYFKHSKYTSFQRQLNYFNFRKWTKSKATVCTFSNDYFVRDQPELSCRITRKKSLLTTKPMPPPIRVVKHLDSIDDAPHAPPHAAAYHAHNNPWSKGGEQPVSISVPRPTSTDVYSHHSSFPSPTDLDMGLKVHDHVMPQPPFAGGAGEHQAIDSFEWIDSLLPFVDRIEDEVYPFMYEPSFHHGVVASSVPVPQHPYEYVSFAL